MNTKTKYADNNACFKRSIAVVSLALMLLMPNFTKANDGVLDVDNKFPAVGRILAVATINGSLDFLGGYCSGSLITSNIFLTAGHCQFFDTRALFEIPGYKVEHWVSFDNEVTDDDFRSYLCEIEHPNAGACNSAIDSDASFHKGAISIVHPDYTKVFTHADGSVEIIETALRGQVVDLAVVFLETPLYGITPLATASLGSFDHTDIGLPLTNVGYGYDFHKSIPADPNQPGGAGPTTLEGGDGLRRIADIGTLRTVGVQEMIPTQQSSLGEDSVCFGDSGSPLFFKEADDNGNQEVSGVLTGWARWCMGAVDHFARVDTLEAVSFLNCIKSFGPEEACVCGIEDKLGLCS